ncbi:MAG: methionine biosynthesis protein MetW [Deltaproteobacteria bacterium]|nr:MAG: methionine biosynthesis protein MetW [Deltaproteobacteria bacterium]
MSAAADPHAAPRELREDQCHVFALIPEGARVLDLGCGDGALLAALVERRGVRGHGVEIDDARILDCVRRGLSVVHEDIDEGLAVHPDKSCDYVILSQTLQATRHPKRLLHKMARVGHASVVSFPNFGHWRVRLSLLLRGRMPKSRALPYEWYDTPNIHLCTLADFDDLVRAEGFAVERRILLNGRGNPMRSSLFAGWRASAAIYLLRPTAP